MLWQIPAIQTAGFGVLEGMALSAEQVDIAIKIVLSLFGVVGTALVSIGLLVVKRLYRSVDTLFTLVGKMQKDINILKLTVLSTAPDKTAIFQALTRNGNGDKH